MEEIRLYWWSLPIPSSILQAVSSSYWSLSRTLRHILHQPWGTSAWYWTISYAAWPTSPRWPDPADLLSTTSAGSDPSSQGKQHSSWSKHSLSPVSTTATRSWLDSLPPWSNLYSVSRMLQQGWPTRLSISQTPCPSSSALLNYLSSPAGTAIAKGKQRLHNNVSTLLYFGTTMVEQAPCQCQDCRDAHQLLQETKDSLVQNSPGLCIASFLYLPPFPQKNKNKYKNLLRTVTKITIHIATGCNIFT